MKTFNTYAVDEFLNAMTDLEAPELEARPGRTNETHRGDRKNIVQIKRRGSNDDGEEPSFPSIDVGNHDLESITAQAWNALVDSNYPERIFRHGRIPVRLEKDDNGIPVITELALDRMRHELARVAHWYTNRKSGEQFLKKDSKPPIDVVKDVLATPDPPLPILDVITESPIFSADGTIQLKPGYHPGSRTYFVPAEGLQIPVVSAAPSVDEIQRSINLIGEVIADFPFVQNADRAHAFALYLLPFCRPMINGPTPNHLIEAADPGSGKSLLADSVLRVSAGRNIGIITPCRDGEEWRKRITSCLREGKQTICIDNVTRNLDSGELAAALTATTWEDRILGRSETISLPVRCVWVTTANNPGMTTELARRCIRLRLDPKQDQPWRREGFTHPELRSWVDENRSELIWAALTLIQAWIVAGRPRPKSRPLGSFEAWSHVIGGILDNAKIDGFLENLDQFYEVADVEGAMWRQFIAEWWDKFGDQEVGVADLFEQAESSDTFNLPGKTAKAQRTAFGIRLSRQRDRVVGGYRVLMTGKVQRAAHWRLLPLQPANSVNLVNVSEPSLYAHMKKDTSTCTKGGKVHSGSRGSQSDDFIEEEFG